MKFQAQHQGKWVAAKNDKIIADAKTLNALINKVKKMENAEELKFSLVPKGQMVGINI